MSSTEVEVRATAAEAKRAAERGAKSRKIAGISVSYLILIIGCCIAIFPFLYIVSLSFKESTSLVSYPPKWIPDPFYFGNYTFLLGETSYIRWAFNTFAFAGSVTALKIFFDSIAGYTFAKMDFPGKEILFTFVLATLMIPFAATLIPAFLIVKNLGMVNTYWGLILPPLASPIGIFMMRQFIESLPKDLENAARLDGCSEFYIYLRIILPNCKPALAVLGIFVFMTQWTNFIWPLVVAKADEMRVLTVGLASLKGQWVTNWGVIAAGSVMLMIPIAIVFIFFQRWFIAGSMAGALKE
ncbi:MAG: carbohydrate ABC transporter permease [Chloroflexi bacterium]|nr:carbohydrate ABC transporter permease [Chloroflexota bacterium]